MNTDTSKSVYAIALTQEQTEKIVTRLKAEGFANDRISVLFADKSTSADFAHEKNTKAPEGAVAGGLSGGILGGAIGWIAGIGALAIPGFGPFIAAGPLAAAIGGAFAGVAVGSIAGALVGLGVPEIEAKRFENKLKDGNVLISVHAKDSDEVSLAKEILKAHDASDVCTAGMSDGDGEEEKVDSDTGRRRAYRGSDGPRPASKSPGSDQGSVEEDEIGAAPSHVLRH